MASPFKGSHHIQAPDREGPSYGDCLESGGRHMALVGEKLASDAMLDMVMCICSGRQPVETCTEGLAYKGPSCGVVAAKSSMNFCQKLPSFLFGDAPLKDSGSTFFVQFSLMDPVGLGSLHYAACLILVLGKFLPSVGETDPRTPMGPADRAPFGSAGGGDRTKSGSRRSTRAVYPASEISGEIKLLLLHV